MHRLLPLAALLLAACGEDEPPPPPAFVIPAIGAIERDYDRVEAVVREVEEGPLATVLQAVRRGRAEELSPALAEGFEARLPEPEDGPQIQDGSLVLREYTPTGPILDAQSFGRVLLAHRGDYTRTVRTAFECDRFRLEADGQRAVGRAELHVGGEAPDRSRAEWRLTLELEFVRGDLGSWRIQRLGLLDGFRVEGGQPRFHSIAAETGFTYNESEENAEMAQRFVDDRRTLALGGLTALDWNDDGFWDLIGTRRGQVSTLFLNDGNGGFDTDVLPVDAPHESGAFLLYVDLNNDGVPELVNSEPVQYDGPRGRLGLYVNNGGVWSSLPTRQEGDKRGLWFPNPVGLRRLAVQTVVPCDVNGDGLLDLFVAVYGTAHSRGRYYNSISGQDGADNHLFINQGDLTFVEESEARGISGTQYTYIATAFDFDGDGDQDLFEGNDFGPNVLWINDGKGHFTPDESLGLGGQSAFTMGATLADYDNTGHWSLYVSNMSSEQGNRMLELPGDLSETARERVAGIAYGNMLYEQGEAGWTERAQDAGVNEAEWAWGCTFSDLDLDGDQDLFVTNGFTSHSDPNLPDWQSYYWRQVIDDARALDEQRLSQDVNGRVEAPGSFNGYERDRYYHNPDGLEGRFFEAGWVAGLDADHDGRAVIPVDIDGDGDLDLAQWTLGGLELLENRGANGGFLRIALESPRGTAGTLGAIVSVEAGGVTQRSVVRLVDGFQSQVPDELTFGLGAAEDVTAIHVRWPSGEQQSWPGLPAGQRVVLTEGLADAQAAPLPRWPEATQPTGLAPAVDVIAKRAAGGSTALWSRGQSLVLRYDPRPEADASWSALAALSQDWSQVRFALLSPEGTEALTGPFEHFVADALLTRSLFGESGPGERPLTLLLGPDGSLRRAYRRELTKRDLSRALREIADESPFPELLIETGRACLRQGRFRDAREHFEKAIEVDPLRPDAYEGLARAYRYLDRYDLTEEPYRRAIQADPDYALGHFNLGTTLVYLRRHEEAIAAYREALRIHPNDLRARLALGEAQVEAGDLESAVETFSEAIDQIDPQTHPAEYADRLVERGSLRGKLQRYEAAISDFERALELAPEHPDARPALELARRLMEQR